MSEKRSRSKSKEISKNVSHSGSKDWPNSSKNMSSRPSYSNKYSLDNRNKYYNKRNDNRSWDNNNRRRYDDPKFYSGDSNKFVEFNSQRFQNYTQLNNFKWNNNKNSSNSNHSNFNSSSYNQSNFESQYHNSQNNRKHKSRWDKSNNGQVNVFDKKSTEFLSNLESSNAQQIINENQLNPTNTQETNISNLDSSISIQNNTANINQINLVSTNENETNNAKNVSHKNNKFISTKRNNFLNKHNKQNFKKSNFENQTESKFKNKNLTKKIESKSIATLSKLDNLNEKNLKLKTDLKSLQISKFKTSKIIKPKLVIRRKNSDSFSESNDIIKSFTSTNIINKTISNNKISEFSNNKRHLNNNSLNEIFENILTTDNVQKAEPDTTNDNEVEAEKTPKISLVPLNSLLKENILSEISSTNLLPDNILDSAKQDLTEILVNKVAKMDKIGIKNIINNPATKFDEALKQKARQHLRDEIRKQLRTLHYEHQNTDGRNDETFESNPLYNHEEISQAVLEQIRRTFGIDFLVEATSSESQPNNDIDTNFINSNNNLSPNKNSELCNNNNNIDNNIVADSTSGSNNNEPIIPFITPVKGNPIQIQSSENYSKEINNLQTPLTIDNNNLKTSPKSIKLPKDSNTNEITFPLNLNQKTPERNNSNYTNSSDGEKLLKSIQEKLKLLIDHQALKKTISNDEKPNEKSYQNRSKVLTKQRSKIGFKENEVLTIDSSSSSSNDSSSSSDSSSDSDSSSTSSSTNDSKKSKILSKYKKKNIYLEADVINKFRRLVLPNLSKYLQKKYDEKYSKTTNNSIRFIYDICLSKIFKNSSLTQGAKKILKAKLKSLKKDEILQFLLDNMKDLFMLSTQEKRTVADNLLSPCKQIENLKSSTTFSNTNKELNVVKVVEKNQIENIPTINADNEIDKNKMESHVKKDLNKPKIQFDKESLNLIGNELKKFAVQQKIFIAKQRTISQSSEKESLSSPTSSNIIDDTSKKNSPSTTLKENSITADEEIATVSANRISSIKNNPITKYQTSNKSDADDKNTSNIATVCVKTSGISDVSKEGNVEDSVDGVKVNDISNKIKTVEKNLTTPLNKNTNKNVEPSQKIFVNSAKISQLENNSNGRNKSKTKSTESNVKDDIHLKENNLQDKNITNLQTNSESCIKNQQNSENNNKNNDKILSSSSDNTVNNKDNSFENEKNDENQEVTMNTFPKIPLSSSPSSSSFTKLSEPENDSADYNSNDGECINSESDAYENENTSPNSSRLWKSPGEKKCIQMPSKENKLLEKNINDEQKDIKMNSFEINDDIRNSLLNSLPSIQSSNTSSAQNNNFESIHLASLMQHNKLEEVVVQNLKEIDLKLLELHKRKMFVEEMILKLQKDKMEIDFTSMQLQNEKFLIINAAVTKNNLCNIQNQQQVSQLSFQSYLNSSSNMLNEPLSASDYISNMFSYNQNPTTPTTSKRKRPNSQSSSISSSSFTKKLRSGRKNSHTINDDETNDDHGLTLVNETKTKNDKNSKSNNKTTNRNEAKKTNQSTKSTSLKKSPNKKEKNCNIENNSDDTTDCSNSEPEDNELDKELLNESKMCENGSFTGFKLNITQIKICGNFLIASSQDGNIYKFCWKTKKLLGKFSKHTESVTQVHIDKNKCIYSISLDGFLKKTSIEEFGLEMQSINLEEPLQCIDVTSKTVYVGSKWGNVFNYNLLHNKISDSFKYSPKSTIIALKATKMQKIKSLKILVIVSKNEPIQIVNALNGHSLKIISDSQNLNISSILLSEGILYCGSNKKEIYSFEIKTGCKLSTIVCKEEILFIKLLKKDLLFIGCNSGLIYIIDKNSGKEIHQSKLSENIITALEFIGEKLIFASKNNKMQMADLPKYI